MAARKSRRLAVDNKGLLLMAGVSGALGIALGLAVGAAVRQGDSVPIYEYQCSPCGHTFEELLRSFEDAADVVCPKCQDGNVQQLLSSFAVGGNSAPACPGQVMGCSDGTSGACGGRPGRCSE